MTKYTRFTQHASLIIAGKWMEKEGIWGILEQTVNIKQKVRQYQPQEKLKSLTVNIMAGGEGVADINNRLRPDEALQTAFGLKKCAEQSTISEMLNATKEKNVDEMREALRIIYQKQGRGYRHNYQRELQLLDIDLSALLAGQQADGASKGYFSGKENRRGRQLGRVVASLYDEIVCERLYPGTIQLERNLPELVGMAEKVLDLKDDRRMNTVIRMDAGGGTDANINFLLQRRYLVITKIKNWQRTNKLVKTVQSWQPIPQLAKHEAGWVGQPHEYEGPTRQLAIRWPNENKEGEWRYCVIVFNLTDPQLYQVARLSLPKVYSDLDLITTLVTAYDLRGGGAETSFRNSKQGLGVTKRNKKSFFAQEMLILLAQLAYNVTNWVKQRMAEHYPKLASFGMLRMIRDAFQVSGKIQFDETGRLLRISLNTAHSLAPVFLDFYRSLAYPNDLRVILGKI